MIRRTFIAVTASICLPAMAAHAAQDPRQFVDGVGKQALSVVNSGESAPSKQTKLRQLFSQNVDTAWMGRFVLGRGWQQATQEQKDRYIKAYQDYLLAHYTSNFADYSGSKYKITDVRDDGNGQYTVNMQIDTPNQQQDTLAGYRVHTDDAGNEKIFDIIIEGVSLITTQRSDFASTLQQQGIDGIITQLQNKTESEKHS